MPLSPSKLFVRRSKLGMTQAEVAKLAKMTQQMYQRIETGVRPDPRLSTAEKIAAALKTTIAAISE